MSPTHPSAATYTYLHVAHGRRRPAGERAGISSLCRSLLGGGARPRGAHQRCQGLGGSCRDSRVGIIQGAPQQQSHVCCMQGMVPHRRPLQACRRGAALLLQRCHDSWREQDRGGCGAPHAGLALGQHRAQQAQRKHTLLRQAAARQQARLLHAVPRSGATILLPAAPRVCAGAGQLLFSGALAGTSKQSTAHKQRQ